MTPDERIRVIDALRRAYDAWQKSRGNAVREIGAADVDYLINHWNSNCQYGRRTLGHRQHRKEDDLQ